MNIKSTIVRRVVWILTGVVVYGALSMLGIGRAHATDRGEAYAECKAEVGRLVAARCAVPNNYPPEFKSCKASNESEIENVTDVDHGTWTCNANAQFGGGYFTSQQLVAVQAYDEGCPAGSEWDDESKTCKQDCASKPDRPATGFTPPNGSYQCSDNCLIFYYYNGDGTSTGTRPEEGGQCNLEPGECTAKEYWHSTLNVCAPIEPQDCPPGVTAQEGVCKNPNPCPSGMIEDATGTCKPEKTECPAGQMKGPDGSCVSDDECPAGKVKGDDGTCKTDADGDGEPDDEDEDPDNDPEKEEFSGGDDCKVPPACSGSPILCGQARIQWRIECNTRKNRNVSGGSCSSPPVCTGENCDAVEYNAMIFQWRASCALEALVQASAPVPGTGNQDQPNWTKVPAMSQDPGQGQVPGDLKVITEKDVDATALNTTAVVGGGGSCPAMMVIGGSGGMADGFASEIANPGPFWCQLIQMAHAVIVLFGALAALYINAKG